MCLSWQQSSALCIRRRESLNCTTGDLSILASLQASLNLTSSPKAAWQMLVVTMLTALGDQETTEVMPLASRQKYHRRVSQGNLSSLFGQQDNGFTLGIFHGQPKLGWAKLPTCHAGPRCSPDFWTSTTHTGKR